MKGFAIITGSVGSATFMSGGTNILLSLPSLFYLSLFLNFERTSEQDKTFPMVKGIAEKRRIELSPNKLNRANNHRTSKLALLKASQTLFACSANFQLQREISYSITRLHFVRHFICLHTYRSFRCIIYYISFFVFVNRKCATLENIF